VRQELVEEAELFDILGRRRPVRVVDGHVDLLPLPAGSYVLRIRTADEIMGRAFVKEP
jgi:hypothetical protein